MMIAKLMFVYIYNLQLTKYKFRELSLGCLSYAYRGQQPAELESPATRGESIVAQGDAAEQRKPWDG